jgi:hypothetical protein
MTKPKKARHRASIVRANIYLDWLDSGCHMARSFIVNLHEWRCSLWQRPQKCLYCEHLFTADLTTPPSALFVEVDLVDDVQQQSWLVGICDVCAKHPTDRLLNDALPILRRKSRLFHGVALADDGAWPAPLHDVGPNGATVTWFAERPPQRKPMKVKPTAAWENRAASIMRAELLLNWLAAGDPRAREVAQHLHDAATAAESDPQPNCLYCGSLLILDQGKPPLAMLYFAPTSGQDIGNKDDGDLYGYCDACSALSDAELLRGGLHKLREGRPELFESGELKELLDGVDTPKH